MSAAVRGAIEDIRRVAEREEAPLPPAPGEKPKKRRVPKAVGDAIDAFSPLFLQQESEWGRVSGRVRAQGGWVGGWTGGNRARVACHRPRLLPMHSTLARATYANYTLVACTAAAGTCNLAAAGGPCCLFPDRHQPHSGGVGVPGALHRQGQPEPAPAQQGAGLGA